MHPDERAELKKKGWEFLIGFFGAFIGVLGLISVGILILLST